MPVEAEYSVVDVFPKFRLRQEGVLADGRVADVEPLGLGDDEETFTGCMEMNLAAISGARDEGPEPFMLDFAAAGTEDA